MNKQKKIFHCALLKKKIYLPKRSFMIAQTISLDILYSLQDCNVSCIAAAPLLRYPEMSAIDLKKFQKTDDASLPGITAFRDKLVLMKMGKEILGYQWSLKDNRPVLTYFINRHDWSNAEIILGYHGQSEVERYFQDSKDTDHLSFQPHYH